MSGEQQAGKQSPNERDWEERKRPGGIRAEGDGRRETVAVHCVFVCGCSGFNVSYCVLRTEAWPQCAGGFGWWAEFPKGRLPACGTASAAGHFVLGELRNVL